MSTPWTADAVLELARAFQPMCVLAAGAELDLFTLLAGHELSASEVATRISGDLRAVSILLDALAGLNLLIKGGDKYTDAPGIAQLLTDRKSGSVLAMVRHQANCLRRWSEIAQVVKTGQPAPRRASIRGEEADHAAFIEAMDNLSAPLAGTIVADLPKLQFNHLLDVGGASGSWTIAFLRAYPQARATLFDLPVVIPQARQRLGDAGLLDRVNLAPGDFYADPLPSGADLVWISAIVHQNSRAQNRELFSKACAATAPGAQLLIRDVLMEDSRTQPLGGALFAVNMLVATVSGGTFNLAELREDLEASGFGQVQVLRRDPWMNSVLSAVRQ